MQVQQCLRGFSGGHFQQLDKCGLSVRVCVCVACATVDSRFPSLACGTTAGKVVIHSPHLNSEQTPRVLNLNRKLSALASGKGEERFTLLLLRFSAFCCLTRAADRAWEAAPLAETGDEEAASTTAALLIGSHTSLLAYDIERNADLFYVDVQEGITAMAIGMIGYLEKPLVFVGGSCSVLGFDYKGNESYWTVSGDNVSSLMVLDIDSDGVKELVVGSDDAEIRVFRGESVLHEVDTFCASGSLHNMPTRIVDSLTLMCV